MNKNSTAIIVSLIVFFSVFSACNNNKSTVELSKKDSTVISSMDMSGFPNQLKWGEHLVIISGCNDCHTPKKMTPTGPEPDLSLAFSGHPSSIPPPNVDRKDLESKGLSVTSDLTVWVGPWGISYSSNISSDSTGIGNWKEDQFILCIRQGKSKGITSNRNLLPPMPWQEIKLMSDNELKAVFAYLKSTAPVKNIVPAPEAPVLAMKK